MFNLLPENLKDEIRKEYKLRRLTVILVFVLAVQASFLIFLFPTWLISVYKEKEIVSQSEQMAKFLADSNVAPATNVIKSLNSKLNVINSALEYPAFVPLMDTVIGQKTKSITLKQFSYTSKDSASAELSIGGTSATRESLVAFVKSLEDTKAFKKVDLPISNLAKDKDIVFTITLTIAP